MKLAVALFALLSALLPAGADAEVYRHTEFRFSLSDAGKHKLCLPPPYEHSTGVWLLLRKGDTDCDDRGVPTMRIYGSYNTLEHPNLVAELDWTCSAQVERSGGTRSDGPRNLKIDSKQSASCQVVGRDGWVEVIVVTQVYTNRSEERSDDPPEINVYARVRTTADRYEPDLAALRKLLGATRILKS